MSTHMEHDELIELLGVYALDAVSADERVLVEDHLRECPRCAAEVAEHREVAAMLANAGTDAPGGVWSKISMQLGAEDEAPAIDLRLPGARVVSLGASPTTPTGPPSAVPEGSDVADLGAARERRQVRNLRVLSVAAVVAVIATLGVIAIGPGSSDDRGVAVSTLDDVADAAFSSDDAVRVTLGSEDGQLSAAGVIASNGSGFLRGDELPALADDRTYQLWGVRNDVVFSLGVLGNDPGVVAFHVGDGVDLLVLTDEVEGGVPQSANPPLAVGEIS